jgi:hypothetical protein
MKWLRTLIARYKAWNAKWREYIATIKSDDKYR